MAAGHAAPYPCISMDPWTAYPILLGAGLVAGTINVVAGGGSFLTLPAMIFLGLPPTVANGTNRIGILTQNVGAVWGFQRHRLVERSWLAWACLPAVAGAVLGTWVAIGIGDAAFRRVLAILMVAVSLWTLWDPLSRAAPGHTPPGGPPRIALGAGFFAVGVYGGFVQAGVGFLTLAVATWAGLDLVRGNALKVLVALTFTPLSLALFAAGGKVEWGVGAVLGAGYLVGGLIGVRLTVLKGHAWVKRVVTVAVIAFAVLLWVEG